MANRSKFRGGDPITTAQIPNIPVMSHAAANTHAFAQTMWNMSSKMQDSLDRIAVRKAKTKGGIDGSTGNYTPREDDTLTAEAYNAAGQQAYLTKLEIQARDKIDELRETHRADPEGMEAALAGYQRSVLGALREISPEMVPAFRAMIESNSRQAKRAVSEQYRQLVMSETAASMAESLQKQMTSMRRLAESEDDDLEFATRVAEERELFRAKLIGSGPRAGFKVDGEEVEPAGERSGAFTPQQIQSQLMEFDKQARSARVIGKFKQAMSNGNALRFIQAFGDRTDIIADPVEREALFQDMITMMNRRQSLIAAGQVNTEKFRKENRRQALNFLSAQYLDGNLDFNLVKEMVRTGVIEGSDGVTWGERAAKHGPAFSDGQAMFVIETDLLGFSEYEITILDSLTIEDRKRLIAERRELDDKTRNWRSTPDGRAAVELLRGEFGLVEGFMSNISQQDGKKASRALHSLYNQVAAVTPEDLLKNPRLPLDMAEEIVFNDKKRQVDATVQRLQSKADDLKRDHAKALEQGMTSKAETLQKRIDSTERQIEQQELRLK